jgi:hypothetical protein
MLARHSLLSLSGLRFFRVFVIRFLLEMTADPISLLQSRLFEGFPA